MTTFRSRLIPIAAALAAASLPSAPAHAINLAPNGKGEVLIFPYYTVRNGFDTLVSVTNTSDRTVLANLRLREAKNGRPVGEFHLALAPHDVWTGAVTSDGADGALIRTFDTSCTAPALNAGPNGSTQVALSPAGYVGTGTLPYDNGGTELSRVQEGFIEVIEMGISTVPEIPAAGLSIETASQHVDGVPRNCAIVRNAFSYGGNFGPSGNGGALPDSVFSTFEAPKNVLLGSATLINVGSGHAYDAMPTTIQNFQDTAPVIYRSGSGRPTLADGGVGMTALRFDADGRLITIAGIARSIDAVSALLMTSSLTNEFAAGGPSDALTDWIVTFPTKHFYTDAAESGSSNAGAPPFSQVFQESGMSCDPWDGIWFGREEQFSDTGLDYAVRPPGTGTCGAVNIVTFQEGSAAESLLGSATVARSLSRSGYVGSSGWARLDAPFGASLLGYNGLPAIGFSVTRHNNAEAAGNNRNYGSGRPHVVEVIATQ